MTKSRRELLSKAIRFAIVGRNGGTRGIAPL